MGLSHGCRVLSDSEIEVYMVCEKGASDQQKLKSSVYIEGVIQDILCNMHALVFSQIAILTRTDSTILTDPLNVY